MDLGGVIFWVAAAAHRGPWWMSLTWSIDTAELHDDDLARVPLLGMAVSTHQVPEQTSSGNGGTAALFR